VTAAAGAGGAPGAPPLYLVLTRVPRRVELSVGALGTVTLARGWYVYVGRARRARPARVARHLGARRALRWHVDHLLAAFPARAAWLVDGAGGECALAAALAAGLGGAQVPPRFGASDCRCRGHLVRLSRRPRGRELALAAQAAAADPAVAVAVRPAGAARAAAR